MADSPLDIFEDESETAPDPAVRRGIGAILGLGATIAGLVLLMGTVVVLGFAGIIQQFATPAQVDVIGFTQLSCRLTAHDVVVSATISRGPEFSGEYVVALQGWNSEALYFDSDVTERLDPGDHVSFSGPAARVEEITGVRLGVWRGELGFAQTIPMTVRVIGQSCVASAEAVG